MNSITCCHCNSSIAVNPVLHYWHSCSCKMALLLIADRSYYLPIINNNKHYMLSGQEDIGQTSLFYERASIIKLPVFLPVTSNEEILVVFNRLIKLAAFT